MESLHDMIKSRKAAPFLSTQSLVLIVFFIIIGTGWGMAAEHSGIYQFTVKTIDGKDQPLADFKDKTLLIVNTASKCGFTPQYADLEKIYEQYRGRGFTILAFPANNFMHQEPGSDEEIKKFCDLRFKVKFPLFSKISVKGKDIHPLYAYLTSQPGVEGAISWNFNKFLVAPGGQIVERFGSRVKPTDEKVIQAIEKVLPKG